MSLPTPYYDDGHGIVIYHGNCGDILPYLPKVDLVLTDPPYGLGDKMQGGTWGSADKYADLRDWDKAPSSELLTLVINKADHAIVWGGHYFWVVPSRCWLIWDKQNAVRTMADCELAWTNFDKPSKRFSWPVGIHSFGHPTEKPLELMKWCLYSETYEGYIILDPFLGSGTTLRAAKELNCKAIGIEIEERYCEIAARRLAQQVLPL
jgi:site-specific DNA-methyltransferase (adenine-specific)